MNNDIIEELSKNIINSRKINDGYISYLINKYDSQQEYYSKLYELEEEKEELYNIEKGWNIDE